MSFFGRHFGNKIEIFSFKLDDESNFCTVQVDEFGDSNNVLFPPVVVLLLLLLLIPRWETNEAVVGLLMLSVDGVVLDDGVLLSSEIVVLTIFC